MPPALRESFKVIIPMVICIVVLQIFPIPGNSLLTFILLLAILFSLYFFRDPERSIPLDESIIVSPADGKVVSIEEIEESPFGLGKRRRIAVFLSVFDVHVNRMPASGTIEKIEYIPGRFLDVRDPRCSSENEHASWKIATAQGPLIVRQIAGLIARRIICWSQEGEEVIRGERIGMIRFGSRTELYLPLDCEILVEVGDKVQGTATAMARWPKPSTPS